MQAHTQEMPILSVTELSNALKRTVESSFSLVRIRGEISSLKVHSSGHMYFSLKDDSSLIDGICWRGTVSRLSMRPEEGMDVVCYGRVTTYPARSKYQVIVDRMELAGVGALMKLLQERKERLLQEGLFDPAHKKPLPFLPKTIGVVTSPTGAVIRDILHRIKDRFPCRVIVWPVSVQGETASQEVSQAIQGFNQLETKPDLLIVARGGGSLEDLWAFNEENVVRAVFASQIPVISAVGHETDTTLIDYVSDQRAPTPTAAAEIAVPVRQDLLITCDRYAQQLKAALVRLFREKRYILETSSRSLLMRHPKRILEERWQTLDERGERLASILKVILERKLQKLHHLGSLLESYSYHKTLERGFVLVKRADGSPIQSSKNLSDGECIDLAFHDGARRARIEG